MTNRILLYAIGVVILALGVTLNTKTGLGVSPLISVPYSITESFHLNTGNGILLYYSLICVLQVIIAGKSRRWTNWLQIPFSIVFTRFMNLFSALLDLNLTHLWQQITVLILAIVCTGIGVSMSVNMHFIANPCDAIVQTISVKTGKSMGLIKNLFDISNVAISFVIGIILGNFLIGIGVGTLVTMLGIGRVISVFNHFFLKKMKDAAGLS